VSGARLRGTGAAPWTGGRGARRRRWGSWKGGWKREEKEEDDDDDDDDDDEDDDEEEEEEEEKEEEKEEKEEVRSGRGPAGRAHRAALTHHALDVCLAKEPRRLQRRYRHLPATPPVSKRSESEPGPPASDSDPIGQSPPANPEPGRGARTSAVVAKPMNMTVHVRPPGAGASVTSAFAT
jgi:hypothetical protein